MRSIAAVQGVPAAQQADWIVQVEQLNDLADSTLLDVGDVIELPGATSGEATSLPDRMDCAEIRGTLYRSNNERNWFLVNCLPTTTPTPLTRTVQGTVCVVAGCASTDVPPTPIPPTPVPPTPSAITINFVGKVSSLGFCSGSVAYRFHVPGLKTFPAIGYLGNGVGGLTIDGFVLRQGGFNAWSRKDPPNSSNQSDYLTVCLSHPSKPAGTVTIAIELQDGRFGQTTFQHSP